MKIIHITPGPGNTFYCENCLRDGLLVKQLRRLGHDAVLVPMYLPLFLDEPGLAGPVPVFYGAISLYLRQRLPLLRRAPRWVTQWLDAGPFLRWAARRAGATQARGLEDMTLSMLRGEAGHQAPELARLVDWLQCEGRPDVIHLSNALLLGVARRLKRELGVPLVCSLQDEDSWVDAMAPAGAEAAWSVMAERAADVDRFIAVSHHYAARMQTRMRIPQERLRVAYLGVEAGDYPASDLPFAPPVLGYLSRLGESLGLGLLVDAFIRLKSRPELRQLRLRAAGGLVGDDHRFVAQLQRRLRAHGFAADAEFIPACDRQTRFELLRSLTVLSVPNPAGEAFGLFQIEAMAAGVPVVQPAVGAFPEIVQATGGGVVYPPGEPGDLDAALAELLTNPARVRELGRRGRDAVRASFTVEAMTERVLGIYRELR